MITAAAVVGPTASGKTAFAIALAKRLNGEIVSCDSMQIYKGLDIGTAKPAPQELSEVRHHLIGFLEPEVPFSVSDYVAAAAPVLADIDKQGKLPIVTGGTGLYARSLLEGISFQEDCRDDGIRRRLNEQAEKEGAQAFYEHLQRLDPAAAAKIHPNNVKRIVRALEYHEVTGRLFSEQEEQSKPAKPPYRYRMLCLAYRDREILYRRIDRRVEDMLANGLIAEAESLYAQAGTGGALPTALQAIGYKELFPYLEGKASLDETAENIKRETRHYAKRQITWFKREKSIDFLYLDEIGFEKALETGISILQKAGIGK